LLEKVKMSWQTESVMEQKILFIKMWQSGDYTMTSLCDRFNISRTTGHKLVNKFVTQGESCLRINSKAPHSCPHKTPEHIESAIIKLRNKYPNWGAKKLRILLLDEYSEKIIPSDTTINAIIKRNGLIKSKRRRNPKEDKLFPKFDPNVPNEIWSADYKGKFKIGNKRYCWPDYKSVKSAYTRVFKEFGLPEFLHTDNGTPFASMRSPMRFSKLCYWLVDLGITPVFSDPASPQQNGRHERMHKDLKAYCKFRIKHTLSKQQIVMNDFKFEYNNIRPHEALNMKTPDSVHVKSNRQFTNKKIPYQYPIHFKVLKVSVNYVPEEV